MAFDSALMCTETVPLRGPTFALKPRCGTMLHGSNSYRASRESIDRILLQLFGRFNPRGRHRLQAWGGPSV